MAVADPGFPVGGGGAPTSDVGTFQQKHMRKQKNWILLGGGRAGGTPLDPPMHGIYHFCKMSEHLEFFDTLASHLRQYIYISDWKHRNGKCCLRWLAIECQKIPSVHMESGFILDG